MILFVPLLVAFFGTAYFVFNTEEDWKWKLLAAGVLLSSLALQFVPDLHVHFLVPFLMQAAVAIVMAIYWQVHR